jgi:predicted nucleotidyltransferase
MVNNYPHMFEIKSKELRLILLYFFLNPAKKYYAAELAEKMKLDPSNTVKALRRVVKEGILAKEKRGGHWFYSLNADYPMINETKKIFLFKYGLSEMLKKKLQTIEGLEEAYIYGSYAKGNLEAESDIDILLIGNHQAEQAIRIFVGLQEYFDREFNSIDMTREEFDKRKRNKDEFIDNIFKGKHIRIL